MIWESGSPDTPRRLLSEPVFLFCSVDVNNPYLTNGGNKRPPGNKRPGTYEGLKLRPGEVGSPEAWGCGQSRSKSSCPLPLREVSKLRQGQGGKADGLEFKRIKCRGGGYGEIHSVLSCAAHVHE